MEVLRKTIDSYSTKDIYLYLKMHNQLIGEEIAPLQLTYNAFFNIIEEFNKAISKEIISGYVFKSPLGVIEIVKRKRKHKQLAINWSLSLKRKQQLIGEGKIPFDKENAPNGEHWYIYFTDNTRYKWTWTRAYNIYNWMGFYPTVNNNRQLGRAINKNEELKDTYRPLMMYEGHLKPKHNFEDFQNLQAH